MASLMRCKRFTIGVTSMTKSSFGGTFEKTALVEGQRWRKVQVPGNKLCLEGYQAFAVTTKEQYAIAQNPVGQRKRGIVQQNEVHIRGAQRPGHLISQEKLAVQTVIRRWVEENSNIHVRKGPSLSPRQRTKQVRENNVRRRCQKWPKPLLNVFR